MTTGSGRYATSGRLSYVLGLRGPSLTLDTACSSSLVAIHLAARSVRSGECGLALAGGVNVILQPHVSLAYSQSGMMAADARCKFGDASADGYVRSEGAAIVVLKPLERAVADGDRVYAVVRGSAVNNDGRGSGSMGTPSRVGQEELLRAAYRDAAVAPGRVAYVEAHGTGTRTGDPVELEALSAVLRDGRGPGRRAFVGSLKTNLGHTEGAAGVSGLVKAALALHHRAIPASLHLSLPTPAFAWDDAPFSIPRTTSPWPEGDGPRVAGVSAFGIAGTNAHVVLEEGPLPPGRGAPLAQVAPALLPLSARSDAALRALSARYADLLANPAGPALDDVCAGAARRRTAMERRAAFVALDRSSMVDALRRYGAGEPATAEGTATGGARRVAFVVPGQGAQWAGMARELLATERVFREAVERCDRAARPHLGWSILAELEAADAARLDDIAVVQPLLVALAIAYAELWRSLGVTPAAVVGHSMGEIAAAAIAGVLDVAGAMEIVCRRSALMRRVRGRGAMALVELSLDEAQRVVAERRDRVGVAASNGPRSSVLSGEPAEIRAIVAELQGADVFAREIKVDVASHSPQMEPLATELGAALAGLAPAAGTVPFYSTVLGRRAEGRELDAGYWARNLREPVLFADAVRALTVDGVSAFVELGPHPILLPSIEQATRPPAAVAVTAASGRRDEPERATVLAGLGALWSGGAHVDWSRVYPASAHVPLPTYPWQRERHWAVEAELDLTGRPASRNSQVDAESSSWLYRQEWTAAPIRGSRPDGRWLVLARDGAAARAVARELRSLGSSADVADLEGLAQAFGSEGPPCGIVVLAGGGDAAFLPVRVLQALPEGTRSRLWFITRGAQAAGGPAAARVDVDQAALWGAARVVGEEHPDLWGGLVDLDPRASAVEGAALLARHLLAKDGEEQVALRGGDRLALRLARHQLARPRPFVWREDASYLITGGLGGVGVHVARAIVAAGARRLVILGRTPLPPRAEWKNAGPALRARLDAVLSLERAGASVHVDAVDVADERQVRAFLARWDAEGWPRIHGVLHAAAVFESHLAAALDESSFDAVMRTKLRGAQLLDRLLPDLDAFVLFSSVLATLAPAGEASYAAANAGLDALAHDRRARGLPATSIAWGLWGDTAFTTGERGQRVAAELGRQGLRPFSPEQGARLLLALIGCDAPAVSVLPIDWAAFRRARRDRGLPLYRELLGTAGDSGALEPITAVATPEERRRAVEKIVRDCVGRVLQISPARLDASRSFGSMGLSSLLAVELRNRLESALGQSLPATLAFNYPTVAALSGHLASEPELAGPPAAQGEVRAPARGAAAEHLLRVAELSDADAALALRASRRRAR
jgi:acyl transferase domain-containing protein/acyl carrier protein